MPAAESRLRLPLLAKLGAMALGWAACGPVVAQSTSASPLWEVGASAFGISQQAYPGSDQQVKRALALPFVAYRGEVLRVDRDTAGLRAIKTPQYQLDIGVAASFGTNADAIEARRGMRSLGTLIELGPRLKWHLGSAPGGGRWRADLPLRAVFDLNDQAAHRGWSFEPELVYENQTADLWRYSASASVILADGKLARNFYEVSAADAIAGRPAYSARSGLVASRLAFSATRPMGADWRLFGFARLDSVQGAANAGSPLVRQSTGATVGVGVAYTLWRSERRAVD